MSLRLSQLATRRCLSRAAENSQQRWLERDTRQITLEGDSGIRGLGEAAPLPGFSPDSVEACAAALTALDLRGIPERLAVGQSVLRELARASSRLPKAVPAARSALEGALLDLWARTAGVPAWALLANDTTVPAPRRVAALLMGEPEQALEQAFEARSRGVTAFKLKIGRARALERELAAFENLRAKLGPIADLRLDVNRAWSAAEARAHLRRFAEYDPEFVEEPCPLVELPDQLSARLALDESLTEVALDGARARFTAWGVRALILKPTLLGGISACCAWAQVAKECGAQPILSHAFEGALGLAVSATLALCVGSEHAAHGLDLHGARLDHLQLPFFAAAQIRAWSEPGYGNLEFDP